ncbi:MAG: phosphopantetheine-binding protein [bacterium]
MSSLQIPTISEIRTLIATVLALGERTSDLDADTPLLGNIPELDSMAVAAVITALEEQYGFVVEDDDIDAETFENLGSLRDFVQAKVQ